MLIRRCGYFGSDSGSGSGSSGRGSGSGRPVVVVVLVVVLVVDNLKIESKIERIWHKGPGSGLGVLLYR